MGGYCCSEGLTGAPREGGHAVEEGDAVSHDAPREIAVCGGGAGTAVRQDAFVLRALEGLVEGDHADALDRRGVDHLDHPRAVFPAHGVEIERAYAEAKQAGSGAFEASRGILGGPDRGLALLRDDEDEGDSGDATAISKTGGNRPVPGVSLTGTSETKIGAMKALSRFRSGNGTAAVPPELSGLWGETGDAGAGGADNGADDGEDPEDDSAEDPEDETFRKTVNLVTAALDDGDPSVREAAFETMTTLPDPEWQVLSLQIMSGDDDALKTRLIDFAKEGRDAFAVTLLMQGLDSDSPGIRAAAGDGLSSLFGLEFESTDAALDWWEENSSNYEFGEGGMTLVGPKDPGDGSDEADIGIAP